MSEIFGYYLPRFFDWVINTTIMASILVGLILAVKTILRNRLTPRWHYLLWMILIVRLLLPWAPGSSYSIYSILSNGYANTISVQNKPVHSINNKPNQEPTSIPDNMTPKQDNQEVSSTPPAIKETNPRTMKTEVVRNEQQQDQQNKPISLHTIPLYIWLAGILVISLISYRENKRLYCLIKKQPQITDKRIVEIFENCKKAMSIRKRIPLLSFDKMASPTVLGFLRPRVLLSKQLINQLTDSQLRHIFYHELSHIKRRDVAFNWLMYCLLILNWFNPILWLAYFYMREDQELACDSYALTFMEEEEKIPYGHTIINLLEHYSNFYQVPSMANLSRNKRTLKRRIFMIKKFQKKSYRWSALGVVAVLAVSSLSLLNAHADGSSSKQIETTEKISKKENKKEQTVYTPPIQKENFKDMTKEEILTKMLNTVDYFKTAKGEFKVHYGNSGSPDSYSIIDYELSLKNNYNAGGYGKTTNVVNGKETVIYSYYRDGKIWDLNPQSATDNEASYLTGEKQGTLNIQDAFTVNNNGENETKMRERPLIGQAMASLFPYEIASNYTRNLNDWEIEKQNEELLGHNTLVIKGKINKIVNKSFRFWVDKDTGILVKYETYDAAGKVNDYLYPTKLEINVPIDSKDFVPKSLDGYKKFDRSSIEKGPMLETGNIDNEIPKELKTQWDEAKKKPNETSIFHQNDKWYISVKRGYLADYIEVNGKEGTLFLAKASPQKSQFIFHALAKGYKVDNLKIKYE